MLGVDDGDIAEDWEISIDGEGDVEVLLISEEDVEWVADPDSDGENEVSGEKVGIALVVSVADDVDVPP